MGKLTQSKLSIALECIKSVSKAKTLEEAIGLANKSLDKLKAYGKEKP